MIENIKKLWKQIDNKTNFIVMAANDLDKSPNTLRHHWFSNSGFWSVPEEHQPRVIELLQNTIKEQKAEVVK